MTTLQFQSSLIELGNKLHFYALSLTSDRDKAADLVQETNLKALVYCNKFAPNTNFKAWVFTIMKNTFINSYRRKIKTASIFETSNKEYLMSISRDRANPSPETFYGLKELHEKIDFLDEEYKIPFTMFVEGYKYKEIAEEMELPLGTVKSRIFFARQKLSKTLSDYS